MQYLASSRVVRESDHAEGNVGGALLGDEGLELLDVEVALEREEGVDIVGFLHHEVLGTSTLGEDVGPEVGGQKRTLKKK